MNTDIRLSVGWNRHPKIVKLKRKLGADGVLALVSLWTFCGQSRPNGILSDMDDDDIAIAADYPGDTAALIEILSALRLIERKDGVWALHDWEDHQGYAIYAEARAEKAKRAAEARWGRESKKNAPSIKNDATSIENHAPSNAPSPSPSPSPSPAPAPAPAPAPVPVPVPEKAEAGVISVGGSAREEPQHAHTDPPVSPNPQDWLDSKVWEAYQQHRREKGAKMGKATAAMVLADLEKARSCGHEPNALLREAIHEGWTGCVFPDRHFHPPKPNAPAVPGGGRVPGKVYTPATKHAALAEHNSAVLSQWLNQDATPSAATAFSHTELAHATH